MENIAKYLVRSPKQVLAYLKLLSAERCLISAGFGESDNDTFLTAIIDIDVELPDEFHVYVNHKMTDYLSDTKFLLEKNAAPLHKPAASADTRNKSDLPD